MNYIKTLILILFSIFTISCGAMVDEQKAITALENNGFTDVEILESHWLAPQFFGCSKEDNVAFSYRATNYKNKRVNVTVCSSFLFKDSTVRH